MEYEQCMIGMKHNLKQTLEIAESDTDPKIKLQARAIANDCYKYIMDLTTNANIISDALKYVNNKTEKLISSAQTTTTITETEETDTKTEAERERDTETEDNIETEGVF